MGDAKVQPTHVCRPAVVYVRQRRDQHLYTLASAL